MMSDYCWVDEERNRVLGRKYSMSKETGMQDSRSNI